MFTPITKAFESAYVGMGNNPIFFNDPSGLEGESTNNSDSDISGNGGTPPPAITGGENNSGLTINTGGSGSTVTPSTGTGQQSTDKPVENGNSVDGSGSSNSFGFNGFSDTKNASSGYNLGNPIEKGLNYFLNPNTYNDHYLYQNGNNNITAVPSDNTKTVTFSKAEGQQFANLNTIENWISIIGLQSPFDRMMFRRWIQGTGQTLYLSDEEFNFIVNSIFDIKSTRIIKLNNGDIVKQVEVSFYGNKDFANCFGTAWISYDMEGNPIGFWDNYTFPLTLIPGTSERNGRKSTWNPLTWWRSDNVIPDAGTDATNIYHNLLNKGKDFQTIYWKSKKK